MTHLMESRKKKKQKIATVLLLDKLHKQDFAGSLSSRASRVLGPISRHRVADILLHMKSVSRASRPGLLVGFLRILCNGLCTAQTFHTEEHDHTCRVGSPNEPDSLTHYNECPRLYNTCFFLETCYDFATKKSFSTRLDHSCILTKPSIWKCGIGLP